MNNLLTDNRETHWRAILATFGMTRVMALSARRAAPTTLRRRPVMMMLCYLLDFLVNMRVDTGFSIAKVFTSSVGDLTNVHLDLADKTV